MEYSFLKPPTETPYNVLSLGAGVQSTAMALMAAKGRDNSYARYSYICGHTS
jgi:hypothetical protein